MCAVLVSFYQIRINPFKNHYTLVQLKESVITNEFLRASEDKLEALVGLQKVVAKMYYVKGQLDSVRRCVNSRSFKKYHISNKYKKKKTLSSIFH